VFIKARIAPLRITLWKLASLGGCAAHVCYLLSLGSLATGSEPKWKLIVLESTALVCLSLRIELQCVVRYADMITTISIRFTLGILCHLLLCLRILTLARRQLRRVRIIFMLFRKIQLRRPIFVMWKVVIRR
jgi:hypothetical protein